MEKGDQGVFELVAELEMACDQGAENGVEWLLVGSLCMCIGVRFVMPGGSCRVSAVFSDVSREWEGVV